MSFILEALKKSENERQRQAGPGFAAIPETSGHKSRGRWPLVVAGLLILGVRAYQRVLAPVLGGQCRFAPTCSVYAIEALEAHGAWRGAALTARRIVRCHPWGGSGDDPVPPRRDPAA